MQWALIGFFFRSVFFLFRFFPGSDLVQPGRLHQRAGFMPPHQLLFEHPALAGKGWGPRCFTQREAAKGPTPHLTAGHARAVQLQRRAVCHPAAKSLCVRIRSKVSYWLKVRPAPAVPDRPANNDPCASATGRPPVGGPVQTSAFKWASRQSEAAMTLAVCSIFPIC